MNPGTTSSGTTSPGTTSQALLTAPGSDTAAGLLTAATLIATAALVAATAADVSVTVDAATISVQVSQFAGDEPARAAIVAVYAHVLRAAVTRRTSRNHTDAWVETRGSAAGHPVHVWTIADPRQVP
jgi:hypothetical protein